MRDADIAVRCLDLTSLRGDETDADISALCERAAEARVAAVVVFPEHVPAAKERLHGTYVKVATVAGGFPDARAPLDDRLFDIRRAVDQGPDEVDVVFDRGLIVAGQLQAAHAEIAAAREIVGSLPMKVILETAEIGLARRVGEAALVAMGAGADFVKTSTGKGPGGATTEVVSAIATATRAYEGRIGSRVGIKVAGGISTADRAAMFIDQIRAELGEDWLTPGLFRIGASGLLEELMTAG